MKTEDKILLRSRMLFIDKGISGTQMTEIAKSTGINRRTLYRYFPTKEHLVCRLQIIITSQLNEYHKRLGTRLTSISGYERLVEFFNLIDINKIRDFIFLNAQFDSNFSGNYPDDKLKTEMADLLLPDNHIVYQLLREGQEDGSIREDIPASDLFAFINQSFMSLHNTILLQISHRGNRKEYSVDFQKLFITITLENLKRNR